MNCSQHRHKFGAVGAVGDAVARRFPMCRCIRRRVAHVRKAQGHSESANVIQYRAYVLRLAEDRSTEEPGDEEENPSTFNRWQHDRQSVPAERCAQPFSASAMSEIRFLQDFSVSENLRGT